MVEEGLKLILNFFRKNRRVGAILIITSNNKVTRDQYKIISGLYVIDYGIE